jgi:hypothetical protein
MASKLITAQLLAIGCELPEMFRKSCWMRSLISVFARGSSVREDAVSAASDIGS